LTGVCAHACSPRKGARARRTLGCGLLLGVIASFFSGTAWATHYRYGRITWTAAGGNTIEFTIENSWRRSAYSTNNNRCRDVSQPTLPSKPCGGPDGFPAVGDVIMEAQGASGGTVFNPGQGSSIGSPLGPLLYLVTAIDPANDWLIGTALDPASLPAIDTNVTKTYPSAGTFTAFVATCCRVSASGGHINNADGNYRVETIVTVGTGNRSPVSSMPPIVQCPINGICSFTVPGSDPDNDPIRFRLSTSTEASGSSSGFTQPGPPDAPNAASINGVTGLFTWNTNGAMLASPRTYYSAQVMIEDLTGVGGSVKSKIPVDFFIQLVSQAGTAPVFDHPPTPACGSILSVNPFDTLNFTVRASDADALQSVTLNASGLPGGATMTPTLPVVGNPVSSDFSWTPNTGQAGQYVVTFTATDDALLQTLCSITIDVTTCQTNADCDDGNACTDDVCDPGNPSANAGGCVYSTIGCDDGNVCTDDSCDPGIGCINAPNTAPCSDGLFCTVGEHCSGGACVGATPRDCGDLNPCTLDSCDEGGAQCVNDPAPLEGASCNDGLFCTDPDTCQGGLCTGPARDCSDGLLCTLDACDENADECTHVLQGDCCGNGVVEGDEKCDDGNSTSGDGCESDCTLSVTCSVSHPGTPTERFVGACGSPSFGTIQAAIVASQDGDIVSVCPGTYSQPITIDKEITLRSTGGAAATILETSGVTVTIARSGVTIEGFTIQSDATAVSANGICPLGEASCASPGARGSNVTLADNVIRNSTTGVAWNGRIDCVSIVDNTFDSNDRHIQLVQTVPTPAAVLVSVTENDITGGGASGSAVSFSGMVVIFAANVVEGSATTGVRLDDAPAGMQVLENEIRQNAGDGITIGAGGVAARVLNNNITNNGVGLGNEASSGELDATLNWWRSQTGPSGVFAGAGDSIVNRSGATTAFIEFLCRPFPQGFPSIQGVCGIESPELRLLFEGSRPDVDPVGGYITFESRADLDRDPRTTGDNADGSQEIFLLSRKTLRKLGGVCLGGVSPGASCRINLDCPGDPKADPLVLNGDCILLTQATDDPSPDAVFSFPRLTARGRAVIFESALDPTGGNGDGSREVFRWDRKAFGKESPTATRQLSSSALDTQRGAPGLSGRRVLMESAADFAGQNADGNAEIFLLDVKADAWTQVTVSSGADNRRPAVGSSGRHIVFDSTGDLDNDPESSFSNADGNREVFLARLTSKGIRIRQLTNTQSPVENRAGGGLGQIRKVAVFSSNGDLVPGGNTDGNREVFLWVNGQIRQVTDSTAGSCEAGCSGDPGCLLNCGNLNPVVDRFGRRVAFESTADLDDDGATNRRVYLYETKTGNLLRLSRSRFGENRVPRISNGRFVVWESTADLTGGNPENKRVIYLFDRRKDE
jgi:cysteine-rich repeat protein